MQNKKKQGRSLLKTYSFSMYKKFHPLFGKYTIPRSNSDLDSICNSCDVLYHIKYIALASKKAFHSLIPFSKYAYQSIVWAVWLNPCSSSTHTNQRKERASGGRHHQNPEWWSTALSLVSQSKLPLEAAHRQVDRPPQFICRRIFCCCVNKQI